MKPSPSCSPHSSVIICVDRLAEVDGIARLLLQHWFAQVAWDLEEEEASVGLGQVGATESTGF